MALRLSGQTSIFGGVFCVFRSLLDIERQMKLQKNSFLTRKPRSHVRILIYRTWKKSCKLRVSIISLLATVLAYTKTTIHLSVGG